MTNDNDEHGTLVSVARDAVGDLITGIPAPIRKNALKAFARLCTAAVEYPVALIENAIAEKRAESRGRVKLIDTSADQIAIQMHTSPEFARAAAIKFANKIIRERMNLDQISEIAAAELKNAPNATGDETEPATINDDWLNVFERYAADASTPRMQELWGKVVAGEIRSPGKYSLRTLRYLSEFSQADGLRFAYFAENAYSAFAPEKLLNYTKDKRLLLQLGSDGLITATEGSSMNHDLDFNSNGCVIIQEGTLAIVFRGAPNSKMSWAAFPLTTLGQELLGLIPGRDPRAAARKVAGAIRSTITNAADLAEIDADGKMSVIENLWGDGKSSQS